MKKFDFSVRRMLGITFLITVVFVLLSCSPKTQNASPAEMEKTFNEAGLRLLRERISPRDFSLPLLSSLQETVGEAQRLSDLKGNVVFLNFWATWCGPCRVEMPSMQAVYDKYRENGLEMLAVNMMEKQADVFNFMADNNFSFPVALDIDGSVGGAYGIQAIPTTFLLDREGKIVLRLVGSIDWDTPKFHTALEMLLNS